MVTTGIAVSREEFVDRQRGVARDAAARGFDALLVWSTGGSALDGYANVFYLTNHYTQVPRVNIEIEGVMSGWGQTALILPAPDADPTLVVESADWRRDLVVAADVRESHDMVGEVIAAIRDLELARSNIGVVGLSLLPASIWLRISSELPELKTRSADDILFARRMVKSDAEVELMRRACAVGAAIQNAMMAEVALGKTDNDVARQGYRVCIDEGAVPWEFAFASGPASGHGYYGRLPAWDRNRRYEQGDIVHPDAYGCVDGYFYDLQRSSVVGGPTQQQRRILDAAVGVVEALCAACRPGTPVAEVANLREAWLADHGLLAKPEPGDKDLLTPLVASGHGLGTGFELPWIYPGSKDVLAKGMTLAIEVYVSEAGIGTGVNEEVVLVTDGEPEVLTAGCPARHW